MKRRITILFVLGISLLFYLPASAEIEITKSVIGGCSGGELFNGSYQLLHSVGQPVVAELTGTYYTSEVGFLCFPWFFITGVDEETHLFPAAYQLYQNYPNPFNPATTIQFALPKRSRVSLKVYDVLGRLVTTLLDEEVGPGIHRVTLQARDLSSGVYFCRINAGAFVKTNKMILVR